MRLMSVPLHAVLLLSCLLSCLLPSLASAWHNKPHPAVSGDIQVGPRPYYLVEDMDPSPLKKKLQSCANGPFKRSDFSIAHRGAPLQFPEHTLESYEAAARMGAGILECDVTFTQDKELVCRHSQCDLHTTTNILATDLAAKCSVPFSPARFDADGKLIQAASARCCASDITLAEFKSLTGKMDAANTRATTVAEYMAGTASWRTDLYASKGTLLSHKESIALFKKLGVKMTPELKSADVPMPFNGFTQAAYAQKLIDEYKQARVPAKDVWPQSFDLQDVRYWIKHEPRFGKQAVYLDGRDSNPAFSIRDPNSWQPTMNALAAEGINIIAPPIWMLLEVENSRIAPSLYAQMAKDAGLDIITWSFERDGPLHNGGGWYFQTLNGRNPHPDRAEPALINNDGDMMDVLDVLARQVGIIGIFSDWPATVTYYSSCMSGKKAPGRF